VVTVYLGLGSNIGDRKDTLCKAIVMISGKIGSITNISSLYESEAWGYESKNKFLNAVIAVETSLFPDEILSEIKGMEIMLGREEKGKDGYEDRPIDIDILFYDKFVFETDILTVPHPHLEKRKFVLAPLAEIAPDFMHPILHKNIKELNEACKDEIQFFEG
jgi:2-amino-4-hydroxy-6-hydroxymethyldihydropteridine diphosphokinase